MEFKIDLRQEVIGLPPTKFNAFRNYAGHWDALPYHRFKNLRAVFVLRRFFPWTIDELERALEVMEHYHLALEATNSSSDRLLATLGEPSEHPVIQQLIAKHKFYIGLWKHEVAREITSAKSTIYFAKLRRKLRSPFTRCKNAVKKMFLKIGNKGDRDASN